MRRDFVKLMIIKTNDETKTTSAKKISKQLAISDDLAYLLVQRGLDTAEKAGAAVFKYGSFISNLINFIIMALVVFCIVKFLNKLRKPAPEAPAEPTTKKCPYCMSEINIEATRCPNCTSSLIDVDAKELS